MQNLARKDRTLAGNSKHGDGAPLRFPPEGIEPRTPGAEMRVRLDDRLGVAAVTYVLFGVKPGPGLALSVVLVFAI